MSYLFEKFMEDCTMLDKMTTADDGLGGFKTQWVEGAKFRAAVVKNSSMQAKIAEKSGVTEVYRVTVGKGTPLVFHDVFRRDSDGAIFRVTSNIKDSETPEVASFQFGQVDAERWNLTND